MSDSEDKEEKGKRNKLSLKSATTKVSAEALRQFHLDTIDDPDNAGTGEGEPSTAGAGEGADVGVDTAAGAADDVESAGLAKTAGAAEDVGKSKDTDEAQASVADDIQAIFEEESGDTEDEQV